MERLFGDHWSDVARFNRIDRRHVLAAFGLKREVDQDDRVLFHDADQQDHADHRDQAELGVEEQEREQRARELIGNGHEVLLIDKAPESIKPERVPDAEWLLADCCEMSSLEEARLERCDILISATGDDKANLVASLLAKTEFGVPRTVGRVNHPSTSLIQWGAPTKQIPTKIHA